MTANGLGEVSEDAESADTSYRASSKALSADEVLECERFGEIAGSWFLAGVPLLSAWSAANRWLDEHPAGDMPVLFDELLPLPPPLLSAPSQIAPNLPLSRPHVEVAKGEVMTSGPNYDLAPPAPVVLVVPRDTRMCGCGHEGSDHVAGGACRICTRSKLGDGCTRFHERRARKRREATQETTMGGRNGFGERVLEALAKGPATREELEKLTGGDVFQVRNAVFRMRRGGVVTQDGEVVSLNGARKARASAPAPSKARGGGRPSGHKAAPTRDASGSSVVRRVLEAEASRLELELAEVRGAIEAL